MCFGRPVGPDLIKDINMIRPRLPDPTFRACSPGNTHAVTAGLVPATYALLAAALKQDVGARHKAGHDG
jgi:hypothetical protein